MLRYVILEHDHPRRHWDFMLEAGPVLRTWRLSAPPEASQVAAEASFDHRPAYLDYEGPISGGRGRVSRWDSGIFSWLVDNPEEVTVALDGRRLRGIARLQFQPSGAWTLTFEPAGGA